MTDARIVIDFRIRRCLCVVNEVYVKGALIPVAHALMQERKSCKRMYLLMLGICLLPVGGCLYFGRDILSLLRTEKNGKC